MDSVTQATLGAAVGHVCAGRTMGRSALLWGAVLGTLPDLDVVFFPMLDTLGELAWHRGFSHSLVLCILAALPLGWLIHRLHHRRVTFSTAASLVFWVWLTHVTIDVFTVYGTQVLEPFSSARIATNNLFIIDPLYTGPLLVGVVGAALLRDPRRSRRFVWWGIALSTLYVGFSFSAKALVHREFARETARQGLPIIRSITTPTPFNTVLWRYLGETADGYWIGYRSLFDRGDEIRFEFIPRREDLASSLHGSRAWDTLRWFSKGYYCLRESGNSVVFSDLRFGELRLEPGAPPEEWRFMFSWRLESTDSGVHVVMGERPTIRAEPILAALWDRLRGDPSAL